MSKGGAGGGDEEEMKSRISRNNDYGCNKIPEMQVCLQSEFQWMTKLWKEKDKRNEKSGVRKAEQCMKDDGRTKSWELDFGVLQCNTLKSTIHYKIMKQN